MKPYPEMNKHITIMLIGLILLNCKNDVKKENIAIDKSQTHPIFIKLGLYPSFDQPAEILINLEDKYLLLYNATAYVYDKLNQAGSQQEIIKKQFDLFSNEKYSITPFHAQLSDDEINPIIQLINSFTENDYEVDLRKMMFDGMCYSFQILYLNNDFKEINPMNLPNKKQFELSQLIIDLAQNKNQNETNELILLTIKDYQIPLDKKFSEE